MALRVPKALSFVVLGCTQGHAPSDAQRIVDGRVTDAQHDAIGDARPDAPRDAPPDTPQT